MTHDLRCVTASLLLLDSFVRNRKSDGLRLLARSLTENEGGRTRGEAGSASARRTRAEELSDEGELAPSRMSVDGDEEVNLKDEEEEMAKARSRCDEEIEGLMTTAMKDFSVWVQPLRSSLLGPTASVVKDPECSLLSGMSVCLRLLEAWRYVEVGDALPALLQLLSSLTQVPEVAEHFLEKGGVSALLEMKELSGDSNSLGESRLVRSYVRSILRHVAEDQGSLRKAMEIDLRSLLSQAMGQGQLTLRSVLKMALPLLERDMETCVLALAHVTKLQGNKAHLREYVSADEMRVRQSDGLVTYDADNARTNVRVVVESLVGLLASPEKMKDVEPPNDAAEVKTPKVAKAEVVLDSFTVGSCEPKGQAVDLENALFGLDALGELASMFPVCGATLIHTNSPDPSVKGSALDYAIQRFLPLAGFGRKWNAKQSDVLANHVSEACSQLLTVLCRRECSAHQHVVDALTNAAAIELDRQPAPRLKAVRIYAKIIYTSLQRRCVLSSFLTSGILDSLLQSLGKLDLNAEGASDAISCVLLTVETLGKLGGPSGSSRRNEDPRAAMPYYGVADPLSLNYRPIALERRLARSMFANMRDSGGEGLMVPDYGLDPEDEMEYLLGHYR